MRLTKLCGHFLCAVDLTLFVNLQYISRPAEEFAEAIGAGVTKLRLPGHSKFYFLSATLQQGVAHIAHVQVDSHLEEGRGAAPYSRDTHMVDWRLGDKGVSRGQQQPAWAGRH